METSARLFNCARYHAQVVLCSCCDRGHRYCGSTCADTSRRESQRAAGQRYQDSRRGRRCHAARQGRYRQRQREQKEKVTHQGSATAPGNASLPSESKKPEQGLVAPPKQSDEAIQCQRCARCCSPFVRLGWLRTPTRRFYRARSGLTDPG